MMLDVTSCSDDELRAWVAGGAEPGSAIHTASSLELARREQHRATRVAWVSAGAAVVSALCAAVALLVSVL